MDLITSSHCSGNPLIVGSGIRSSDVTTRVGNIHISYKRGGNWERDLFIESSRSAASSTAGALTGYAGGVALSFLMVATPLSTLYTDADLLYEYTNRFDRILARIFFILFSLSGSAIIILGVLDWIGFFD